MDLTDELRRQLEDAIYDHLGAIPTTQGLRGLVGPEEVRRLPAGLNPYQHAQWVLRVALAQPTPATFIDVVRKADLPGALGALQTLATKLEAEPGIWSAPVVAGLWMPKPWPFIDRTSVVTVLKAMADGGGPAAVAIEGSSGHGKKTMVEFIRCLADEKLSFQPSVVELRKEPEPGVLASVVTQLSMAFGELPDLDTTHVEPERQATILARDIAQLALGAATPTWFVARFADSSGLEEGLLVFFDELLGLVQQTPAVGDKLRVVLVCDQVGLLELKNAPPLEARHTLSQVSDAEIRAWLEAAAPGKPPQVYELFTQTVMTRLETAAPPPQRRLELVSSTCAVTHRKLLAVADA